MVGYSPPEFPGFIPHTMFYFLLINFVLICFFFFYNRKEIAKRFVKVKRLTWLIFLIIVIIGAFLRFSSTACSDSHGLLFSYVETAEGMLKTQYVSDLWHPKGYSLLMTLGFLIFGLNFSVVYFLNLVLSTLTISLVFLLCYVLFKRDDAALFSALIYALLPNAILFAKINASEVTSTFFITLTAITFFIALDANKKGMYFLFLLLAVFSLQVRTDAAIFLPMIAAGILLNRKRIRLGELKIPLVIFSVLMIPVSFYFIIGLGGGLYGPLRDPHYNERPYPASIGYVIPNVQFMLSNNLAVSSYYPSILYAFLFLSLLYVSTQRGVLYIALWVAGFFMFFGLWWMTIYNNPELYELAVQPPISILMGFGISLAAGFGARAFDHTRLKITNPLKHAGLLLTLCLIVLVFYTGTGTFRPNYNGTCLLENIVSVSNRLPSDGCIMVENVRADYGGRYYPVDIMKILMPGKFLSTNISSCDGMDKYYFGVDETQCPNSFFGRGKPLFESIEPKYAIKEVDSEGCVSIYSIESKTP